MLGTYEAHSALLTTTPRKEFLSPEIPISDSTIVPSKIRTPNSETEVGDGSACTTVELIIS